VSLELEELRARRCAICGGSAGDPRQFANGGAHERCKALAAAGLPTPSLGDRCEACHGHGRIPRSAVGPMNPTARDLAAWAPACAGCKGTGIAQ
jgi:hypothetical protein